MLHCSPKTRALLRIALTLAVALPALALAIHSAVFQWYHRDLMPTWDMIDVIRFLDRRPNNLPTLLELYSTWTANEHRPYIPFYLVWIDYHWFGASGAFLYPVLYALVFALALISISWTITSYLLPTARILSIALSLVGFFWVGHYENLTWEMQVHEVLCLLLVSVACLTAASIGGLEKEDVLKGTLRAALAGMLSFAATFSFAFGVASFAAIGVHGLLSRWRLPAFLVFSLFAVVALALYLNTYVRRPSHTDPIVALAQPMALLGYAGVVLSAPFWSAADSIVGFGWGAWRGLPAWLALGLVSPVALLRYARPALFQPTRDRALLDFALLIVASTVIMAVMIALGRLTINAGEESRYAVVASMFWTSIIGIAVLCTQAGLRYPVVLASSTLCLLLSAMSTPRLQDIERARAQDYFGGAVAATLGVFDAPEFQLYPRADAPASIWSRPRGNFPSFAERVPFVWIGHSIDSLSARARDANCLGYIDAVIPLDEQRHIFRVDGWGFGQHATHRVAWVAIVDDAGTVVGLGRPDFVRPDILKHYESSEVRGDNEAMLHSGFRAVARLTRNSEISLWLIDRAGQSCLVAKKTL
jgi:hypothetical protein